MLIKLISSISGNKEPIIFKANHDNPAGCGMRLRPVSPTLLGELLHPPLGKIHREIVPFFIQINCKKLVPKKQGLSDPTNSRTNLHPIIYTLGLSFVLLASQLLCPWGVLNATSRVLTICYVNIFFVVSVVCCWLNWMLCCLIFAHHCAASLRSTLPAVVTQLGRSKLSCNQEGLSILSSWRGNYCKNNL